MTITNSAAVVDDTGNFLHAACVPILGDDFKSYVDMVKWSSADQLYSEGGTGTQPVTPAVVTKILSDLGDERKSLTPLYYAKSKVRDTSLGGNPVINPLPQYNETDDPPATLTISRSDGSLGMGRVYSKHIDDNQRILWLQAGRQKFNTIAAFYTGCIDPDMAVINDKGIMYTSAYKIGKLITTPLSIMITIPTIAIEWLYRWGTYKEAPITSYYDFQSEQPLYYRYVNTILAILAVNMGFMESAVETRDEGNADEAAMNKAELDLDTKLDKAQNGYTSAPGTPDYLYKMQMDISLILRKRMKYLYGASQVSDKGNDTLIHEMIAAAEGAKDEGQYSDSGSTSTSAPDSSAATSSTSTTPSADATGTGGPKLAEGTSMSMVESAFAAMTQFKRNTMDGITAGSDLGTYYAMQFIGFRLESTASTQESIRNTPRKPEIDQTINSKVASIREKAFSVMGSVAGAVPVIGGMLSGITDAISGALSGVLSNTGLDGLAQLATGSAMVEIPKIWDNSEFSNSYSFEVHLRAEAGDDLSILQSVFVPFACLLALGSPRGQGVASYTSPFLVKAFSKGTVSIPMGMITNLNITRGASQHGWSRTMKPREMKITFEIEDLTPTMFVSMGSVGWKQKLRDLALGTNNKFISYLEMLSGVDLRAKVGWQAQKRRAEIIWHEVTQQKYAGLVDGMRIGALPPVRILAALAPASWSKPNANADDRKNLQ